MLGRMDLMFRWVVIISLMLICVDAMATSVPTLVVRDLESCDTIDTDADGVLTCGDDATIGGGAIDYIGTPATDDIAQFTDVDTVKGMTYAELAAIGAFEAAWEAVMDLQDLQGACTDGQVPNNITIDLSTLATTFTCTDNEATNENNTIVFVDGATGSQGAETDGDFHYNPSTGLCTATGFAATSIDISGTATIGGIIYADGNVAGLGLDVLRSAKVSINLEVGQNITVGGTVDGVDIAARDHAAAVDIGDDTNLAGTANEITLIGDTLSIHADIARDTELAAQDACNEITNCVPDAMEDSDIDTFSELQSWVVDETLLKAGTLTDTKYCIYDSASTDIICNSEGGGGGNDVYIEEGDASRVDSSGADLYLDFFSTDFDVVAMGNEANVTISDGGVDHGGLAGLDTGADHSYIDQDVTSGSSPTFTTVTGNVSGSSGSCTGLAATATALAANPSDCGANTFATAIDAEGDLTCTSVDIGDDTNLAAGRSLTMSGDSVEADAELYVFKASIAFEDPVATDDFFFGEIAVNATATSIYCKTLVGTVNLDVQIAGVDINGSDITCNTSGVLDSSLGGDTDLNVGEELKLAITSVATSPTYLMVIVNGTYDD